MPRIARLSIPGALHHVMARGIEGRSLFTEKEDREYFLSLLSHGLTRSNFKCYAWVLMDNHYHLLLRLNERPLSELMRPLNSKYAQWFRKKSKSTGYVFQNRFKSIVTQDQGYIERLIRYIHLNPIRAGICKTISELDRYPWSGHAVIIGNRQNTFQDTKAVLKRFGSNHQSAVHSYRAYILTGAGNDEDRDFIGFLKQVNKGKNDRKVPHCWVIGDQEFVKKALDTDHARRIQIAQYTRRGITIEKIAASVATQMEVEAQALFKRGRRNDRSKLRKMVAALGHRQYQIPVIEIARYLGVGSSSISRMLDEGERLAIENKIS